MRTELKKIVFVIVSILCLAPVMYADWDQGDPYKMHFPQMPNPTGWDIDLRPYELADDWKCSQTGDVNDIHFWISWKGDVVGTISNIQVKIYNNDPNIPSKPAQQLWFQTIYDFSIRLIDPNGHQGYWIPTGSTSQPLLYPNDHTSYYQVNIKNIQNAFPQVEGQIYWLSLRIQTTTPSTSRVGWKTSLNHFMDAAVVRYTPGPVWQPLYEPNSTIPIDFAFVITGGQEPNVEPNYPPAKWLQRPDLSTNGVDVKATEPLILADDFECNKSTLITDITVWGSWKYDTLPQEGVSNVPFTLSIHSDIPASQGSTGYSMPNDVLWHGTFLPSEVSIEKQNIDEGWFDSSYNQYIFPGDHVCWKYVFHIPEAEAFCQKGEPNKPIVYWLDVQAHPNPTASAEFGWKSSINHWNDDAVWTMGGEPYIGIWQELRYPPGHPLCPNSIDLAFAIDGNIPCNLPEHDLGDAPDSSNNFGAIMTTYPSGIAAHYPTVYLDPTGLPPYGPIHWQPKAVAWLGPNVTLENEADIGPDQDPTNNIIPLTNTPDQDGADDGVLGMPLTLFHCCLTSFQYRVNAVRTDVNLYVNVWFDWNRDGDWDDTMTCGTNIAPEWAVQNQLLPAGSLAVGLNTITTPQFRPWHPFSTSKEIWMRITLSEQPWVSGGGYVGDGGSGPANGYLYGETEDYYFTPITECFPNTDPAYAQWLLQGKPFAWCCPWQSKGDATGDGSVSGSDLIILKASYGRAYGTPGYDCRADFTHDGTVSGPDLIRLKSNYGNNYGSACRDDWKNNCGPNP
ncbi:MAG: GEVED domain-containing protein [Sedimentisphaerales bacterium]